MKGYTTIADRIADTFAAGLDMEHISYTQVMILHAIKAVAIKGWAKEALRREQGETNGL